MASGPTGATAAVRRSRRRDERTCAVGRRDDGVAAVARTRGDDVVGRRLSDRDACSLAGARKGGEVRRVGGQQRRQPVAGSNRQGPYMPPPRLPPESTRRVAIPGSRTRGTARSVRRCSPRRRTRRPVRRPCRGHSRAGISQAWRRAPLQLPWRSSPARRSRAPVRRSPLRRAGSAPGGHRQLPPPTRSSARRPPVAAIIRQDRNIAPPPIIGESLVRDSATDRGIAGDRAAGGSEKNVAIDSNSRKSFDSSGDHVCSLARLCTGAGGGALDARRERARRDDGLVRPAPLAGADRRIRRLLELPARTNGQAVRRFARTAVPLPGLPARVVPRRERPARGLRPRRRQPRAGFAEDPRRPAGRGEAARDRLARVALLPRGRELGERLLPRASRPGRPRGHELRLVRRARQQAGPDRRGALDEHVAGLQHVGRSEPLSRSATARRRALVAARRRPRRHLIASVRPGLRRRRRLSLRPAAAALARAQRVSDLVRHRSRCLGRARRRRGDASS